jgi:hypothetical protein
MKSSDLFGVAVRTVGLISLLYALGSTVLLVGSGFFSAFGSFGFVVKFILWVAISIYLLRGAPGVVRFAYAQPE